MRLLRPGTLCSVTTYITFPQGTLASSILTGALTRVKQLPIIVLEVDVKFTVPQLQQLLVQLKSWGSDTHHGGTFVGNHVHKLVKVKIMTK